MFFTTKPSLEANNENSNSFYKDRTASQGGMLSTHGANKAKRSPRVLLVDDDLSYGKIIKKAASHKGFDLTYCQSIEEFSVLSKWEYDVIIMDYDLGYVTGCELANYIENYVKEVTVVLVSQTKRKESNAWPKSIKGFVSKSLGPHAVLDAVFEAHKIKQASKKRSKNI